MLAESNIEIFNLIATIAHKNRHNWESSQNLQAERLLAAVIRKLLVAGNYRICYRDEESGSIKVIDQATMNPSLIAKTLGVPASEDPVDTNDLLRPSTEIRFFDVNAKKWGEFLYDNLAVFMIKEELPHKFTETEKANVMDMVRSWSKIPE